MDSYGSKRMPIPADLATGQPAVWVASIAGGTRNSGTRSCTASFVPERPSMTAAPLPAAYVCGSLEVPRYKAGGGLNHERGKRSLHP